MSVCCNKFMNAALLQAKKATLTGDVPVGAVIVKDDVIIAKGRNKREKDNSSIAHAEIDAISKACKKLGTWRLHDCEMYITLEPCPMCAGAIINSRLKAVHIGTPDPKGGAVFSKLDIFSCGFNHTPLVTIGTMQGECSKILSDFFAGLRKKT